MKKYDGTPSKKKFKGFNFYIQCNDKLSRKNRTKLLKDSEIHIGNVIHTLKVKPDELINQGIISELDSSLSDIELLNQWNGIYESHGYLMNEFKERWEKEQLKGMKDKNESSFKLSDEFEQLKERVKWLEEEVLKLKIQLVSKNTDGKGY